jgi:flagellin-like protein
MRVRAVVDTRAVSPVVGVILMVAVTVVLAAVIGASVLGATAETSTETPTVSVEFVFDGDGGFSPGDGDDTATIIHEGGDELDAATVSFSAGGTAIPAACTDVPAEFRAGEAATVAESSPGCGPDVLRSGQTLRLVFSPAERESTAVLAETRVPG